MPHVSRRGFVEGMASMSVAAGCASLAAVAEAYAPNDSGRQEPNERWRAAPVMTVRGRVDAAELGVTLVHEHVLVDFVGADRITPDRYDRDAAFRKALPHLREAYARGVRTLVECTPAYLGRDPQLLLRLSQATGLHIVTNTGYYGAAEDKFVPAHAFEETPRQLADRWIAECIDGIDGTDIKPGFMKIGVDAGSLSTIDRKLVEAAILTSGATGLAIASHTGDGVAAHEQMDLIEDREAPLSSFIWVHAQNEKDIDVIRHGARRGAWISLDGVSESSAERHRELVLALADADLLDRVLMSHDAGWYRVGEPDGGEYRPHEAIFTDVLPTLRERLGEAALTQLLVENPARALSIRS